MNSRFFAFAVPVALLACAGSPVLAGADDLDRDALPQSKLIAARDPRVTVTGHQIRTIEGWTVLISDDLLKAEPEPTAHALELLTGHLREIARTVPATAVAHLRTIPLWISPKYPDVPGHAEYHPGAGWLKEHGRSPQMAKGVEFTNVDIFEHETKRMPVFVLHELAHSYHDQVLGFDNPEIKAAYERAKASGAYDHVERWNGPDRPVTHERAYAMSNEREYFAECTEAFFGRNDFFPFTREELQQADPEMCQLLRRLWQVPAN